MIGLWMAFGADLEVCRGAPGCYRTIQEAVDAAAPAGDVVQVHPGIYDGAVSVSGKSLVIRASKKGVPPVLTTSDPTRVDLVTIDAGAVVTLDGLSIGSAFARGLLVTDPGTVAVVHGCLFDVTAFRDHGTSAFVTDDARLDVRNTVFEASNAAIDGGHVAVSGATLTLTGSTFSGGSAGKRGGSLHVEGASTLEVVRCTFASNRSFGYGGAVALEGDVHATFDRTDFVGDSAVLAGGALVAELVGDASLAITGGSFAGDTADDGGALYLFGSGEASLVDVALTGNAATGRGGAVAVDDGVGLTLTRSTFCANTAARYGGAIDWSDTAQNGTHGGAASVWTNARFVDNVSGADGGGAFVDVDRDLAVTWSAFLGNRADFGAALSAPGSAGQVDLRDDLVGWSDGQNAVYTPRGALIATGDVWFGNGDTDLKGVGAGFQTGGNLVGVDPQLYAYSPDGDCADDDLGYRGASPLRARATAGTNPDGSAADVGAYGGPLADPDPWQDPDHDGWPDLYDCADRDPSRSPGAVDACYDGVDQDCDGVSDLDCDHDGYDDLAHGGTDCDDADPAVHPLATEIPYDGVDQDCVGGDLIDVDGDGYGASEAGGPDCDDRRPGVHPGAVENPGPRVDRDCDGWTSLTRALHPVGCESAPGSGFGWTLGLLALGWRRRK